MPLACMAWFWEQYSISYRSIFPPISLPVARAGFRTHYANCFPAGATMTIAVFFSFFLFGGPRLIRFVSPQVPSLSGFDGMLSVLFPWGLTHSQNQPQLEGFSPGPQRQVSSGSVGFLPVCEKGASCIKFLQFVFKRRQVKLEPTHTLSTVPLRRLVSS